MKEKQEIQQGYYQRKINFKKKKLCYSFGAALPGMGFELVIPEFLVGNTTPFEKEQF